MDIDVDKLTYKQAQKLHAELSDRLERENDLRLRKIAAGIRAGDTVSFKTRQGIETAKVVRTNKLGVVIRDKRGERRMPVDRLLSAN